MDSYKLIESKEMYKGAIFDVVRDVITLPDGREAERDIVVRDCAATVLPIDADGNIVFVRQYRHAARKLTLEIPAGMLNKGESLYDCAARELTEETGYTAGKLTFMFKMYMSIGFCTEVLHIYLAEDLVSGQQNLDDEEFVTIEKYSLDEAIKMIFNGDIIDSKTIAAVMSYREFKSKNK